MMLLLNELFAEINKLGRLLQLVLLQKKCGSNTGSWFQAMLRYRAEKDSSEALTFLFVERRKICLRDSVVLYLLISLLPFCHWLLSLLACKIKQQIKCKIYD